MMMVILMMMMMTRNKTIIIKMRIMRISETMRSTRVMLRTREKGLQQLLKMEDEKTAGKTEKTFFSSTTAKQ